MNISLFSPMGWTAVNTCMMPPTIFSFGAGIFHWRVTPLTVSLYVEVIKAQKSQSICIAPFPASSFWIAVVFIMCWVWFVQFLEGWLGNHRSYCGFWNRLVRVDWLGLYWGFKLYGHGLVGLMNHWLWWVFLVVVVLVFGLCFGRNCWFSYGFCFLWVESVLLLNFVNLRIIYVSVAYFGNGFRCTTNLTLRFFLMNIFILIFINDVNIFWLSNNIIDNFSDLFLLAGSINCFVFIIFFLFKWIDLIVVIFLDFYAFNAWIGIFKP